MANQRIFQAASKEVKLKGMGTTIVSGQVVGDKFYIAPVGDSRCYRIRGEARVAMGLSGRDAARVDRWRRSVETSAALGLPMVWVVRDVGDPSDVGALAGAAGVRVLPVSGSDVREVHGAGVEAVERARSGGGPTVIAAATPDGDPVALFAEVLVSEGTLDRAGVEAIGSRAAREFNRAHEFGQRSPLPDPSELTAGVFAAGGQV